MTPQSYFFPPTFSMSRRRIRHTRGSITHGVRFVLALGAYAFRVIGRTKSLCEGTRVYVRGFKISLAGRYSRLCVIFSTPGADGRWCIAQYSRRPVRCNARLTTFRTNIFSPAFSFDRLHTHAPPKSCEKQRTIECSSHSIAVIE